jgi:dCMP deaminase
MAKQDKLDTLYMDLADRVSQMSVAVRAKVGAILVKDDNIISMGWNGTPAGDDNTCEVTQPDGTLVTKEEVLHAESNCLMKLASGDGVGSAGSTLYVTMSPCRQCAKLIKQAKIKRVVFRDVYRDMSGVEFLLDRGVEMVQITLPPAAPVERTVAPSVEQPATPRSFLPPQPSVSTPLISEVARLRQTVAAAPPPPAAPAQSFDGMDEVQRALAEAGLTMMDGLPVAAPVTSQPKQPPQEADGYTSSFL